MKWFWSPQKLVCFHLVLGTLNKPFSFRFKWNITPDTTSYVTKNGLEASRRICRDASSRLPTFLVARFCFLIHQELKCNVRSDSKYANGHRNAARLSWGVGQVESREREKNPFFKICTTENEKAEKSDKSLTAQISPRRHSSFFPLQQNPNPRNDVRQQASSTDWKLGF